MDGAVVSTTRKLDNGDDSRLGRRGYCGGVRPPLPPRHDITAPEEPFHESGSIYLSSFFIVNFSTRTCLSGSSLISLSLLGFRVGSSLFGILFVKPFFFVNLICMSMFRFWVVGLKWALSHLISFWAL